MKSRNMPCIVGLMYVQCDSLITPLLLLDDSSKLIDSSSPLLRRSANGQQLRLQLKQLQAAAIVMQALCVRVWIESVCGWRRLACMT